MRKSIALFLALLLLPAAAQSEAADEKCIQKEKHKKFTYLLVDRSDRLEDKDGFEKSIAALKEMLQPGERLLVGVSTGKGSDTRILMDFVRPEKSLWVSALKIRALQKRFKECLDEVATELLADEEEYERSALLETLSFVSKVFAIDKSEEKRLVLYSDMMQNSPSVSFYSMKPFKPENALKAVEKERLLLKFPSVDVFAAGTGENISDKQSRELEAFWSSYFEKAGGELKFYGPILVSLG